MISRVLERCRTLGIRVLPIPVPFGLQSFIGLKDKKIFMRSEKASRTLKKLIHYKRLESDLGKAYGSYKKVSNRPTSLSPN